MIHWPWPAPRVRQLSPDGVPLRLLFVSAFLLILPAAVANGGSFTETFATTAFRDAVNTTADWNTAEGVLKLFPFSATIVGAVDTPGNARDLLVRGNLAFVTDASAGLQIIDVTDPENPIRIGGYGPTNNVQDVALHGDYAYLADSGPGLLVVDVSDPALPTLAGAYNPATFPDDVSISGDLAVVGVALSGIEILDLSNPTSPLLIGALNTPGLVADTIVVGELVYVADFGSGVHVVSLDDPTAPLILGSLNTPGEARGIALDGHLLFVADNRAGLQILDVSDPTNPTLIGFVATPSAAEEVAVAGDRVFVACGASGLAIVDVSDPTTPVLLAIVDTPGSAAAVMVAGVHAFVADSGAGLEVVQIAEAHPPFPAIAFDTGTTNKLEVAGGYAYLPAFFDGLRIVDVSTPSAPVEVGSFLPPGGYAVTDVAVLGRMAAIAVDAGGVMLVDLSDPQSPTPLARVPSMLAAQAVAWSGRYVYSGEIGKFRVIDVSNPIAPALVDSIAIGSSDGIEIVDGRAYAWESNSISILDITDPTSVSTLWTTPGLCICSIREAEVEGDHVYVTTSTIGLTTIDVSNPTSPVVRYGTFDAGSTIRGVSVSGDVGVLSTQSGDLVAVDMTNPNGIVEIGRRAVGGTGNQVLLHGRHAYLAGQTVPLRIAPILQDEVAAFPNVAWSTPIDGADDTILRARVLPVATGDFQWLVSADGGLGLVGVEPGAWVEFPTPGNELRWRASLLYEGVIPTVDELTVEWLNHFANITKIADVPNDQGRQVRVEWRRSAHDFVGDAQQIVQYAVYRQIDPDLAPAARGVQLPAEIRDHAAIMKAAGWDFLTTVPVRVQDDYAVVVPTLADSTVIGGLRASTFMVTAFTATPGVFFDSPPASGYSVDNLAPAPPENVVFDGVATLTWDPALEDDFAKHTVYGSASPVLDDAATPLGHTTQSSFTLTAPLQPHYFVTTSDFSGNESSATALLTPTSAPESIAPRPVVLHGAVPNPFNPRTTIGFDLPRTELVRLTIHDVSGRHLRTLLQGARPAGRHEVTWNGVDESGRPVASGVYLYRLRVGSHVESRSMTLLK